jgi:hypothetical protein
VRVRLPAVRKCRIFGFQGFEAKGHIGGSEAETIRPARDRLTAQPQEGQHSAAEGGTRDRLRPARAAEFLIANCLIPSPGSLASSCIDSAQQRRYAIAPFGELEISRLTTLSASLQRMGRVAKAE